MLARLTNAAVVTDDTMLPEWRTLLLRQSSGASLFSFEAAHGFA